MKYLLTFSLLISVAYGQVTVTVKAPATLDALNNLSADCPTTAQFSTLSGTVATQGTQITTLSNSLSSTQITVAKNTSDIAALQQGNAKGIPSPIIKTSSFTVSDSCHNRTIYMNCNGCTVTLPTCTAGLQFWVQAAGGTVTLINPLGNIGWISGSTKTLSINSRPVMVSYKSSQITNAR